MLKRILAIGAALAVLLTVSACRSSKSAEDGSSSGYTGSDYTYDGSSGSSEQQSGDSSTTSGSSNGGQTGTSSKPTASIPSKTGGNAVMVDPGFLDGIDPFKDPVFKEQVTNLKGKTIKIGTFWPNNYKSSNSDPVAQANVKAIAAIKKDYNCEIKMVYMDANSFLSDVATSTASGNIYADIYEIQGEMADLYKNGYFADLSKVKSVGLNTNGWSQASIVNATYKNVCYGVGLEKYIGYSVVYFNKALASKYRSAIFTALLTRASGHGQSSAQYPNLYTSSPTERFTAATRHLLLIFSIWYSQTEPLRLFWRTAFRYSTDWIQNYLKHSTGCRAIVKPVFTIRTRAAIMSLPSTRLWPVKTSSI